MAEFEDKLSALMSDPALMQQVMALAQSLEGGQNDPPPQQPPQPKPQSSPGDNLFGGIDPAMLQRLSGFAQKSNIDKDQRALLHALTPYLSHSRISRLERAMQAARMAGFATSLLGR